MAEEVERFDQFVTCKLVLTAKAVWVGAFLNLGAFEGSGDNAAAGDYFALMNAGADAGDIPGIDFAELHIGFGEGNAFDLTHGGVGFEKEVELRFERDFEGIFLQGRLPTVDVGVFRDHFYVAAFCEGGSFRDGDGLGCAGGDASAG